MDSTGENQSILNTPMSQNWKFYIYVIIISIVSFYVIRKDIESLKFEEDGLFGAVIFLWFGLLKLIILAFTIDSLLRAFRKKKKIYLFPLTACFAAIFISITVEINHLKRNSSPLALHGFYDGDINGLDLKLYQNSSYQLRDYSVMGGTIHYGNYHIKSDTIYLSQSLRPEIGGYKLFIDSSFILMKQNRDGEFIKDVGIKLKIINFKNE